MLFLFMFIFIGLHASIITGDQTNLNMCMQSKTVTIQVLTGNTDDDLSCQCQASRASSATTGRRDYTHTPGVGSHKLHRAGHPWNEARRICAEESAHLAIINSKAEEAVLLNMLRESTSYIHHSQRNDKAFVGIHDMFQEGEWLTIFGESLESTGFSQWTDAFLPHIQPDNAGGDQNCGTLITRGGLDDDRCYKNYAFFCELPLSCL